MESLYPDQGGSHIHNYKPSILVAVIEAKDNNHSVGDGMQQALVYAEMMDVPFVYSTNGDSFIGHDRTARSGVLERELPLDTFPAPEELWRRYCAWKGIDDTNKEIVTALRGLESQIYMAEA